MPGVVAYVDHTDIPGLNQAVLPEDPMPYEPSIEQLFTSGRVFYAGQAIGLILADSFEEAHRAARAVTVTYKNLQKPILSIKEALQVTPEKVKKVKSTKIGSIDGKYNI